MRPALQAIRLSADYAFAQAWALTPAQRKEMRTALHGLSTTNCPAHEYHMRLGLLYLVESLIRADEVGEEIRGAAHV